MMNSNSNTNVPELRFRDDLGNEYPYWEMQKFSAIATKINDSHNPKINERTICIELENIVSNSGTLAGTSTTFERKSTKSKFRAGDVLFGKLRPYLNKYFLTEFDGVCTTEIWVLRAKSVTSKFLYLVVQSEQFYRVANYQFGSKMPRSDWKLVSDANFYLPSSVIEQQKISEFLSSINTRIEQLEKKKSLFEQYKKGLMQKLFSQEFRFKNDHGSEYPEWKAISLKQVGETYGGLSGKRKVDFGDGKKYVQYLQVFENSRVKLENCGLVRIQEGEKQHRVCKGDVLFTVSSETRDEVGVSSVVLDEIDELYLNSFCFGLRLNTNKLSPDFARYLFRNREFRRKIIRLSQGSTRFNLSKKAVMQASELVPNHQEQQKIADFLSSVDRRIELMSEQIEKTRQFKKGLLQRMFV